MKTRMKTRSCILFALAFFVPVFSSRLSAQSTDVTQLEVGGYVLRLGMTTEQVTQGIGKAFKTQFNAGPSSFTFEQNDVVFARVYVENGRVTQIDKLVRFQTRNEGVSIVKEFLALRRIAACRFTLDEENIGDETTGVIYTSTECGNVGLKSRVSFYSTGDIGTGFQLYIFSR